MLAAVPAALQERHPVSGRVIAPVMGVGGAGWLERPEREAEEEPSRAIEALDLRTGMTVADIGAGSGYYTVRMARKVGAEGRVYATDIQVGMLSLIQRRAKQEMLQNIVPVLGAIDDPKLPSGSLDLALMVEDPRVPIREEHKMSLAQVRDELSADGYAIDKVIDVLPWQHIIVLKAAR